MTSAYVVVEPVVWHSDMQTRNQGPGSSDDGELSTSM